MNPNVLLIITDQQRTDTLGFRNLTPCRTPNIDRIASEGISFDNAITPCPLCLPSRAALFSGLYPTQNNMMDNATSSLVDCALLTHFKQHGYDINYAGKWHMGEGNIGQFTDRHAGDDTAVYSQWCEDQGLIDGWMYNDPRTRTHRTPSMSIPVTHKQDLPVDKTNEAYITGIAEQMIRSRKVDAPFFQVCAYNGPHPPFMVPEPFYTLYDPQIVLEPPNFGAHPNELDANRNSYYRKLFNDHGTDFNAWRKSYAVYWGFVSMIDDMVGRLLATLEAEGVLDDTIVVFVSDHGENLGAHGLWHKMVAYNESISVPMLIRPSVNIDCARGISHSAPVSLIDVVPTLASLCGLSPLTNVQGLDLSDTITGGNVTDANRALYAMHQPLGEWMGTTDWRMVQSENLKYIWHRDGSDELYDQSNDPYEMNNLCREPLNEFEVDVRQKMLIDFMKQIDDPLFEHWPSPNTGGHAHVCS